MNIADMIGAIARRWYIVVAGVLLAAAAAYGVWSVVPPEYTRSSTQLLLPGPGTIPEGGNPFLFVGGLSQAADVLVRTVGSADTIRTLLDEHPDAQISVARDPLSSGPVVMITVTSQNDVEAGQVMDEMVARTAATLTDLQIAEGISSDDRITVVPLTVDARGVIDQKDRLVAVGAAAAAVLALTLIAVAIVDVALRARAQRRRRDPGGESPAPAEGELIFDVDDTDDESVPRAEADSDAVPESGSTSPDDEPVASPRDPLEPGPDPDPEELGAPDEIPDEVGPSTTSPRRR